MAKKLSDIAERINTSADLFLEYLEVNLDSCVSSKIKELSQETDVFIFSGVIRNFFLKKPEIRDIDLVLRTKIDVKSHFKGWEIRENSYGGYKIGTDSNLIDLWFLENTWAYQYQKTLDFDLDRYIPATAFFNFSSIVFSYNKKEFYFTEDFLQFLRDKEIDVVYEPNANYALCVVNTFYYADKYNLRVSDNLKKHIAYIDRWRNNRYDLAQIKHFGKIVFTDNEIHRRIEQFSCSLSNANILNASAEFSDCKTKK